MPVLRTYTADLGRAVIPGTPRASASDFGGQTAGALAATASVTAALGQQMVEMRERQDMLSAYRQAAELRERALALQDELVERGEPVAEGMAAFLETELADFRAARTTQQGLGWADQRMATMRGDMLAAARALDARRMGEEAKHEIGQALLSTGRVLSEHPFLLEDMIAEHNEVVDNTPGIPPHVREQLNAEGRMVLAGNAVQGWIRADAPEALRRLEEGEFNDYLSPDQRLTLEGNARTAVRREQQAQRDEEAEAARQRALNSDIAFTEALSRVFDPPDGSPPLSTRQVTELLAETHPNGEPVFSSSQANALYRLVRERATGENVQTQPQARAWFLNNRDTITSEQLTEALMNGQISGPDYERWMNEVQTGDDITKRLRANFHRTVPTTLGTFSQFVEFDADLSRIVAEVEAVLREGEQRFRAEGRSVREYYTSGQAQEDTRAFAALRQQEITQTTARLADETGSAEDMAVGEIRRMHQWNGQEFVPLSGDEIARLTPVEAGATAEDVQRLEEQAAVGDVVFGRVKAETPEGQRWIDTRTAQVGQVQHGLMYIGGDPADLTSWQAVPENPTNGQRAGQLVYSTALGRWLVRPPELDLTAEAKLAALLIRSAAPYYRAGAAAAEGVQTVAGQMAEAEARRQERQSRPQPDIDIFAP